MLSSRPFPPPSAADGVAAGGPQPLCRDQDFVDGAAGRAPERGVYMYDSVRIYLIRVYT